MMRGHLACLAFVAVLFLAVWLWEQPDCTEWFDGAEWDDADWPEDDPAKPDAHPAGLATFDGGRTTIPPKISGAAIARLRGL